MPAIASTLIFSGSFKIVTPIPGNGEIGGACNDGNGQALYAVYDNGAFKVYRTRSGFKQLRDEDGSVDYLSTVLTATPKLVPSSTAIQQIGGTFYVTISAWLSDGNAGTWIYRDTGGGGAGPWVSHGTVNMTSGATGTDNTGMTPFASEILVLAGGTWVANAPVWSGYGTGGTTRAGGVYTSADGGATWTNRLLVGWYLGGTYGATWSRNFGQYGAAWYVGGLGNTDPGKHYSSTDCITWTDIGSLGTAPSSSIGYTFPISTPEWIYRWAPAGDYGTSRMLQSAAAAPESGPLWANVADTTPLSFHPTNPDFSFPLLCNIGAGRAQMWVATNFGQVLGIAETPSAQPPCRQYPREDGLGTSSARRQFPQPRSEQGGIRRAGGTYY